MSNIFCGSYFDDGITVAHHGDQKIQKYDYVDNRVGAEH